MRPTSRLSVARPEWRTGGAAAREGAVEISGSGLPALLPSWHFAIWVGLLTAFDVGLRHRTMSGWTAAEREQYAISWLGSIAFWWAAFRLLKVDSRPARHGVAFFLGGAVLAALVWLPFSVFFHYQTFPNRDALLFMANAPGMAISSLPTLASSRDLLLLGGLCASIWIAAWRGSSRGTTRLSSAAALLVVVAYGGAVAMARVSPNLPLTPVASAIKSATDLLLWKGKAPDFFELRKRFAAPPPASAPPPDAYNFIWVVGESFGAEYLKSYGGQPSNAPNLERLLHDPHTVDLEHLNSNSSCTDVSVPSLLSGLDPTEPMGRFLSAELPYDYFKARGFGTFLVSSHKLSWAHLDSFLGDPELDDMEGAERRHPNPPDNFGAPDTETYAAALRQMDGIHASGRSFFGVVHVRTLHEPYDFDPADPPDDRGATRARYGIWDGRELDVAWPGADQGLPSPRYLASMRHFDRMLGDFLATLGRRSYGPRTLIVFDADHGEAFGQHGFVIHCGSYYSEESHVPGFVFAPPAAWSDPALRPKLDRLVANRGEFVSNVDLLPTLLDLAGLSDDASSARLDGEPLTEPLSPDRRYLFSNCAAFRRCPLKSFGFYQNGLRYLYRSNERRWEVFDEASDPQELHDVSAEHGAEIEAALPSLRRNQLLGSLLAGTL